jgi:hypothetical protein
MSAISRCVHEKTWIEYVPNGCCAGILDRVHKFVNRLIELVRVFQVR